MANVTNSNLSILCTSTGNPSYLGIKVVDSNPTLSAIGRIGDYYYADPSLYLKVTATQWVDLKCTVAATSVAPTIGYSENLTNEDLSLICTSTGNWQYIKQKFVASSPITAPSLGKEGDWWYVAGGNKDSSLMFRTSSGWVTFVADASLA